MVSAVVEHLESNGIEFELYSHADAGTALEAAPSLGYPADEVLKVVVLDIRTGHALAVVPAASELNVERVKQALNTRHVTLATHDEIERDYPEFDPGELPPIASLVHTPLVVDPSVLEQETVVVSSGEAGQSVRARAADIFGDSNLIVAPIVAEADTAPLARS